MSAPVLTPGIIEFLLARIADDKAEFRSACAAEAERLRHDGLSDCTAEEIQTFWLRPDAQTCWPRWMAECEAKRKIVEQYQHHAERAAQQPDQRSLANMRDAFYWAALALATIYADHPDYRKEWKL